MTQSQNISVLEDWWEQHHSFGGGVYIAYDRYTLSGGCQDYLEALQWKYDQISQEEKQLFASSETTDNSMKNRETLEDAAKITMLVNAFVQEKLNFHVQLVHEPWLDRWRVHPGSGRYAAQWICGMLKPKLIYTHFNEPEFKIPPGGLKIKSPDKFIEEIQFQNKDAEIDFQTYYAFPTNSEDEEYTKQRDGEWNPKISTDIPWQFLRYSEGKYFLDYKSNWREFVFDFNLDKLQKL